MATKRNAARQGPNDGVGAPPRPDRGDAETTGRYIVLLREGAEDVAPRLFADRAGVSAVVADQETTEEEITEGSTVFPHAGAAVIEADPEQFSAINALSMTESGGESVILAVEPERFVYAIDETDPSAIRSRLAGSYTPRAQSPALESSGTGERVISRAVSVDYIRGYRDSIDHLADQILSTADTALEELAPEVEAQAWDESHFTWGLQATNVSQSRFSGRGIKVCVLDTGFGPHPDFAGRSVQLRSFVPGQAPADGHGHGTHCIGTACGPRQPRTGPRYGIAYGADIFAGKVLSNQGSGQDAWILAGINWALANGVHIVSMSLGAPTAPGSPPSPVYEGVAQRALARGTIIVAAAGNESQRPSIIRPVGRPANCPSIFAVAALDPTLGVSFFSNGGLNPNGGEVNIAAPGRDVLSAWPLAPFYRRLSGTSMATPHVAGIAALFAEATGARGTALWQRVAQFARHLAAPRRDVGEGLVRAR